MSTTHNTGDEMSNRRRLARTARNMVLVYRETADGYLWSSPERGRRFRRVGAGV